MTENVFLKCKTVIMSLSSLLCLRHLRDALRWMDQYVLSSSINARFTFYCKSKNNYSRLNLPINDSYKISKPQFHWKMNNISYLPHSVVKWGSKWRGTSPLQIHYQSNVGCNCKGVPVLDIQCRQFCGLSLTEARDWLNLSIDMGWIFISSPTRRLKFCLATVVA